MRARPESSKSFPFKGIYSHYVKVAVHRESPLSSGLTTSGVNHAARGVVTGISRRVSIPTAFLTPLGKLVSSQDILLDTVFWVKIKAACP
jgi:hypothetical protein